MTINLEGNRKFIMGVVTLAASIVMIVFGIIPADQITNLILGVLGLFTAGNVGEHLTDAMTPTVITGDPTPQPPTS